MNTSGLFAQIKPKVMSRNASALLLKPLRCRKVKPQVFWGAPSYKHNQRPSGRRRRSQAALNQNSYVCSCFQLRLAAACEHSVQTSSHDASSLGMTQTPEQLLSCWSALLTPPLFWVPHKRCIKRGQCHAASSHLPWSWTEDTCCFVTFRVNTSGWKTAVP